MLWSVGRILDTESEERSMLDCFIWLIIYVIISIIVLYIVEVILQQFPILPPPVFVLIRLLVGLLIVLWLLSCLGVLVGTPGGHWRLR